MQTESACAVRSHVTQRGSHGQELGPEARRRPAPDRPSAEPPALTASREETGRGGRLDSPGETRTLAVAKAKGPCPDSEPRVLCRDRRPRLADLLGSQWREEKASW